MQSLCRNRDTVPSRFTSLFAFFVLCFFFLEETVSGQHQEHHLRVAVDVSGDVPRITRVAELPGTLTTKTNGDNSNNNNNNNNNSSVLVATYLGANYSAECVPETLHLKTESNTTGGRLSGEVIRVRSALCIVELPSLGSSYIVTISYNNTSTGDVDLLASGLLTSHSASSSSRRDNNSTVLRRTVQYVGETTTQPNFIFVSAGYLSGQHEDFFADVSRALKLFQHPIMDNVVVGRYFPLMNVFAVFEPSTETGATKVRPSFEARANNLLCTFSTTSSSRLTCDIGLTMELSSFAPPRPYQPNNYVIALVNEETYGGAAVYSTGIKATFFYNAALRSTADQLRAASLLYHETGHCIGDLMDEYDFGQFEDMIVATENCHWAADGVPWSGWVEKGLADRVPTKPCGYSNYYKSTETCIMSALDNPKPCSVCAEATTRKLYLHGMDYFGTTCPHKHEIVYVSPTLQPNASFYVNHKLAELADVRIVWDVDGEMAAPSHDSASVFTFQYGVHYTAATTATGGMRQYTVRVNYTDLTDYVLPNRRAQDARYMNQSRTWTVRVAADADLAAMIAANATTGVSGRTCDVGMASVLYYGHPGTSVNYVAACQQGQNCTTELFTTHLVDRSTDANDTAGDIFEDYVLSVMGVVVAGVGIGLIAILWAYARVVAHQPNPVTLAERYPRLAAARWTLVVTSFLILGFSAAGLVLGLYLYSAFGVFLSNAAITTLVFVLVGIIAGIVGILFWCYYLKRLYVIHWILLVACLVGCLVAAGLCLVYGYGIDDEGSSQQEDLQSQWMDGVRDDPDEICRIQRKLECSGFGVSCPRIPLSSACPRGCDSTNANFQQPCKPELVSLAHDWYVNTGWVLVALSLVVILSLASSTYLLVVLWKEAKRRDEYVASRPKNLILIVQQMSEGEYDAHLRQIERLGIAVLDAKRGFPAYFRRSMEYKPTEDDISAALRMAPDDANRTDSDSDRKDAKINLVRYLHACRDRALEPRFDESCPRHADAVTIWESFPLEKRLNMVKFFVRVSRPQDRKNYSVVEVENLSASNAPDEGTESITLVHDRVCVLDETFLPHMEATRPFLPSPSLWVDVFYRMCSDGSDIVTWTDFAARFPRVWASTLHDLLTLFYRDRQPEKLDGVRDLVVTIVLDESLELDMWSALQKKYGAFPTPEQNMAHGGTLLACYAPEYNDVDARHPEAAAARRKWTTTATFEARNTLVFLYRSLVGGEDVLTRCWFGTVEDGTSASFPGVNSDDAVVADIVRDFFRALDADGDGVVLWTDFLSRYESSRKDAERRMLLLVYGESNPRKLESVDDTVEKWHGREDMMWGTMRKKYSVG